MTTNCDTAELSRVNDFNAAHPIGSWVRYWTGTRDDAAKSGQTRTRAQLLGGHTAVVWVTGQASCIALTHVDPIPGQPDDVEDDSHDLPDLAGAAERVGDYIAANGDGIYDVIDGHPLYARDIEALRRAADTVWVAEQYKTERDALKAKLAEAAELRAELDRVRAQLTAANHHTDNLAADIRDMQKANTAYANEVDELREQILDDDERQRAASAIRAYIRLCGSRIPADHPYHAIAAKLAGDRAEVSR